MILEGVKVLELASVLAGPSVGMFLAELGAEVIKVENAENGGDVTRSWLLLNEKPEDGVSSYFACANWGKKSININLLKDRHLLDSYIKDTDIVLVSYKPGDAKKFNLDYDAIKEINPTVIYGEVTGYGTDDPRVAYDVLLQAEAGFMYMNRLPNQPFTKFPSPIVDIIAAHHLKEAILASYIKKLKTQKGSYVSVSLLDASLTIWANVATAVLIENQHPEPQGSLHANIAPYGEIFQTKDGESIILAVGTNKQFNNLCAILNLQETSQNPLFQSNQSRLINRKELAIELEQGFKNIIANEFLEGCKQKSVPAAIVNQPHFAITTFAKEKKLKFGNLEAISQIAAKGIDKQIVTPPPSLPNT